MMTPEEAIRKRDLYLNVTKRMVPDHNALGDPYELKEWVIKALEHSSIVIWKPEIYYGAIQGAENLYGITPQPNNLRLGPQFWVWEHDNGPILENKEVAVQSKGVLYAEDEYGFFVMSWGVDENGEPKVVMPGLTKWGDTKPSQVGLLGFWAASLFMQQEFVATDRIKAPHHLRRAAEMGRRPPIPEISVVVLRKSARKSDSEDDARTRREFNCQYIQRGHWCRPSSRMKTPQPVYRRPHLRGNPAKELRAPRELVYAVTR